MSRTPRPSPFARLAARLIPALLTAVAAVACTEAHIRTAPFRDRPDSVAAGDLRGPFTGKVVDAATDKPIAGALVYATWTIESGYGFASPRGHKEHVTSTDAGGNYRIPALTDVPRSGSTRLVAFHLVIYKRGYVAYRSDRRFEDLGPRRDFAQRHNRVPMERWRDDFSHARHLRYVGGGPAIASLTAWEVDEAAQELFRGGRRAGIGTELLPRTSGVYVVAAQLLTQDDIVAVTGYDGSFESGPLGDQPDTTTYSSQHLKALGRPESYDVALRVWRGEPDDAKRRYTQLTELPGAEVFNEIATRSLRATEGGIFGVAFIDERRNLVALLTCGKNLCDTADKAADLAKRVFDNVEASWPVEAQP